MLNFLMLVLKFLILVLRFLMLVVLNFLILVTNKKSTEDIIDTRHSTRRTTQKKKTRVKPPPRFRSHVFYMKL